MSANDHILERRADLLAAKLTARRDSLAQAIAPPGQRPPFTEQLSQPEALNWWRVHYHDDLGAQVLANMDETSKMELDLALKQATQPEGFGGFGG